MHEKYDSELINISEAVRHAAHVLGAGIQATLIAVALVGIAAALNDIAAAIREQRN